MKNNLTSYHKNYAKNILNLITFIIFSGIAFLFYIYFKLKKLKNIDLSIDYLNNVYSVYNNLRINYMIFFTIILLGYSLFHTYQLMIAKNDVSVNSLREINKLWFGKTEGILFKLISMWSITIVLYMLKPQFYIKMIAIIKNLIFQE